MKYLFVYLLVINAAAFVLMRIDKQKARKREYRIPEAVLIGSAVVGGSLGAWFGMQVFRHKTRHKKFTLGIPFILGIQALLAVIYWYYFM